MYRIKPKKGYSVLIKDLGLKLDAFQDNWKYVAKEEFDSSADAQSIKDLLHIEDASKPVNPVKVLEENHGIAEVAPKVFVARKEVDGVSSDIFVAQPQETIEVKETVEVKETEVKETEVKEIATSIIETKVEDATIPDVIEDAAKAGKKNRGQKK